MHGVILSRYLWGSILFMTVLGANALSKVVDHSALDFIKDQTIATVLYIIALYVMFYPWTGKNVRGCLAGIMIIIAGATLAWFLWAL